jgi:hypothetical protein
MRFPELSFHSSIESISINSPTKASSRRKERGSTKIDFSPLSRNKTIKKIDIRNNPFLVRLNLEPLATLKNLEYLDISKNSLGYSDFSLSPLRNCLKLQELYFNNWYPLDSENVQLDITSLFLIPNLKIVFLHRLWYQDRIATTLDKPWGIYSNILDSRYPYLPDKPDVRTLLSRKAKEGNIKAIADGKEIGYLYPHLIADSSQIPPESRNPIWAIPYIIDWY